MIHVPLLLLCVFSAVQSSSSASSNLGKVLNDLFDSQAETVEVCILGDSEEPFWTDTVNEFIQHAYENHHVLIQPKHLKQTRRSCSFYLVLLKLDMEYAEVLKSMLASVYWNRFAVFVFVTVIVESVPGEIDLAWIKYASIVHSLGIVNSVSVLWIKSKMSLEMFFYNQFGYVRYSSDKKFISQYLWQDYLLDVNRHVFRVSFQDYITHVMIKDDNELVGPYAELLIAFVNKVNATLSIADLPPDPEKLRKNKINLIFSLQLQSAFFEIHATRGLSNYCLMIEEKLTGSFFDNLLYPFSNQLWILLVTIALVTLLVSQIFQNSLFIDMLNKLIKRSPRNLTKIILLRRFCLHGLSIMTFVLSKSYLAKMLQFFFNSKYEPHISSMDEFTATNLIISCPTELACYLLRFMYPKLSERIILESSATNVALYKLCEATFIYLNSVGNIDQETGKLKFYSMKQPVNTICAHTVSRMDPFTVKFSSVLNQLVEGGFMDLWYKNHLTVLFRRPEYEDNLLNFKELISLWYILIYGWGISFVMFFGEILVASFGKRLMEMLLTLKRCHM